MKSEKKKWLFQAAWQKESRTIRYTKKSRLECTAIRLRNQTICQYPTTSKDLTEPRVAETEVTFDFLRCEELS